VWRDENHIHLWVENGDDGWDDSVWFEGRETMTNGDSHPSGVQLRLETFDELVAMRLAQLLEERALSAAVDRALERNAGNGGCLALQQYAGQIKAAFSSPPMA
jgi:hypothetical protein